jgi:hypothetical protein
VILRDPKAWYFKKDSFFKIMVNKCVIPSYLCLQIADKQIVMNQNGVYKWPTGETLPLPNIQTNSTFVTVKYPFGKPDQAEIVSTRHSKGMLFQNFFHYYVSTLSKSSRRCRGCNQPLYSNSLCLHTHFLCILLVDYIEDSIGDSVATL